MCSGISSFVSKAVSVVSSAVKAVGKVITETATKFLSISAEKISMVVNVLETIAKALGIIKEEENAEELGDKAMKADKKPEDFDSINEYIGYLRQEIRSSRQELEQLSPEQRLARQAIGSSILLKGIEEKRSLEIPVEFWKETVERGLNAKQIDEFLKQFKQDNIEPKDFVKYLKKEVSTKKEEKIDKSLIAAYKRLEPELDELDIEEKVVDLQRHE
jgi:hypothetical protein